METMSPVMIQAIASVLVTGVLEGVKFLFRRFIMKNELYEFPVSFYTISVPVLNALTPFALVYGLGIPLTDPILTLSAVGVLRYVAIVALGALGSIISHDNGIKPLKNYAQQRESHLNLTKSAEVMKHMQI